MVKDIDFYKGATKSFPTIYFPPNSNGKEIGKPLKTSKGALIRAYKIIKDRRVGDVVIRFNVEWENGTGTSGPFAKVINSGRGRCKCVMFPGSKTRSKTYWLYKDGRLER